MNFAVKLNTSETPSFKRGNFPTKAFQQTPIQRALHLISARLFSVLHDKHGCFSITKITRCSLLRFERLGFSEIVYNVCIYLYLAQGVRRVELLEVLCAGLVGGVFGLNSVRSLLVEILE